MKRLFLPVFLFLGVSLFAFPQCAPDLESTVKCIYELPEGKALIKRVEAEGAIKVIRAPLDSGSGAMWCGDRRTIILNSKFNRSFGQELRSILFELHNAATTRKFMQIDSQAMRRQISRENYIRTVEWIEHQNAVETCRLIAKGRAQNLFPRDADWPILKDFESHFAVQQEYGHSDYIAHMYDMLGKFS